MYIQQATITNIMYSTGNINHVVWSRSAVMADMGQCLVLWHNAAATSAACSLSLPYTQTLVVLCNSLSEEKERRKYERNLMYKEGVKREKKRLHFSLTAALASSHPIIINASLAVIKLQSSLTSSSSSSFLGLSFIFCPRYTSCLWPSVGSGRGQGLQREASPGHN